MFNNWPKFKAGGTIAPCRFVKLSAAFTVVQAAADTDFCIGISQKGQKRTPGLPGSDTTIAAESGDEIDVHGIGDVAYLEIGTGGLTVGDFIEPDSVGKGVLAAAGVGKKYGAIALETAAAAVLARVLVLPGVLST